MLGEAHEDVAAPNGLAARLHEIQAKRRDARAALAIARERRASARITASRAICGRIAVDYRKRVAALASALHGAVKANGDLAEITDAHADADIAWVGNLPAHPAKMLGHRGDKVSAWLEEAVSLGLIDKGMISEGLR